MVGEVNRTMLHEPIRNSMLEVDWRGWVDYHQLLDTVKDFSRICCLEAMVDAHGGLEFRLCKVCFQIAQHH